MVFVAAGIAAKYFHYLDEHPPIASIKQSGVSFAGAVGFNALACDAGALAVLALIALHPLA